MEEAIRYMSIFKKYRRTNIAEMRPVTHAECRGYHTALPKLISNGVEVSISKEDRKAGSPKIGDMIARNPDNHDDQWLVSQSYYENNFEPVVSNGEGLMLDIKNIGVKRLEEKT